LAVSIKNFIAVCLLIFEWCKGANDVDVSRNKNQQVWTEENAPKKDGQVYCIAPLNHLPLLGFPSGGFAGAGRTGLARGGKSNNRQQF
jgi:hypothetical protein